LKISIEEQLRIIQMGEAEIIDLEGLRDKLLLAQKEERRLIIKFGLDPTAPDIHLGHTVALRKARQFQELGHKVVIIIGDFTGRIGDPTGKSKTRKPLTIKQIEENAETYKKQIFRILDEEKTEVCFNSQWLSKLSFQEVLNLASKYTVARMLEREDFKNRFQGQKPIGIHEFFYPLMQAYDSIAIKADVELGGMDQKFNILMGRTLQKEYGQEKQIAILMPILEGIDGIEKMSKSLGNYVGVEEAPGDMFIKLMTIPDSLIIRYFELATNILPEGLDKIKKELAEGANPRDIKERLSFDIVSLYHGVDEANNVKEAFTMEFREGGIPKDILEIHLCLEELKDFENIISSQAFRETLNLSGSEIKRLLKQGGIKLNKVKVSAVTKLRLKDGDILSFGKRLHVRINNSELHSFLPQNK